VEADAEVGVTPVKVGVGVADLGLDVGDGVGLPGLGVGVGVGDGLGDGVGVGDGVGDGAGDGVGDGVRDGVGLTPINDAAAAGSARLINLHILSSKMLRVMNVRNARRTIHIRMASRTEYML
jgi:hypothetical protein